jgi:hypothetical protein
LFLTISENIGGNDKTIEATVESDTDVLESEMANKVSTADEYDGSDVEDNRHPDSGSEGDGGNNGAEDSEDDMSRISGNKRNRAIGNYQRQLMSN